MLVTDPIADMLTRIRNALIVKHDTVDVPVSVMKLAIADILLNEGYIKGYTVGGEGVQKMMTITLKYGANRQGPQGSALREDQPPHQGFHGCRHPQGRTPHR